MSNPYLHKYKLGWLTSFYNLWNVTESTMIVYYLNLTGVDLNSLAENKMIRFHYCYHLLLLLVYYYCYYRNTIIMIIYFHNLFFQVSSSITLDKKKNCFWIWVFIFLSDLSTSSCCVAYSEHCTIFWMHYWFFYWQGGFTEKR